MNTREHIEQVLAKYNVALPDASLDALSVAMDDRAQEKVQVTNGAWLRAADDALERGDTHALRAWRDACNGKF